MALLTLDEAAARVGASRSMIDDWVQNGFLAVHQRPRPCDARSGTVGLLAVEDCVDEEELFAQAESLGWFMLGAENWDSLEDQ